MSFVNSTSTFQGNLNQIPMPDLETDLNNIITTSNKEEGKLLLLLLNNNNV
jgi:hypothetical protein